MIGVRSNLPDKSMEWLGVCVSRRGQCDSLLLRRDEGSVTLPPNYVSDWGSSAQGRNPAGFQDALCELLGAISMLPILSEHTFM